MLGLRHEYSMNWPIIKKLYQFFNGVIHDKDPFDSE